METDGHYDAGLDWGRSVDVLSALVRNVGLHGVVLSTMALGSPWRLRNAHSGTPFLHVINDGRAYLRTPSVTDPIELDTGDVVLLPTGEPYEIVDAYPCTAPDVEVPRQRDGSRCSVRVGGRGPQTEITCCTYRFDTAAAAPFLNFLPPLIIVRADDGAGPLRVFVNEIVRESKHNRPGTEGMISRLAELAFLGMLRAHLEAPSSTASRLLSAIADPQISQALGLVHASLASPWTVANLASGVGMSRAAFSRLFTDKTGIAPIRYVQLCRLQEAKRLLQETMLNSSEIGQSVGYSDGAGFSRAFRRDVGVSPLGYRNRYRKTSSEMDE